MILNKEAYNTAKKKHKISCQCDYCGKTFERLKHNVIRSHINIQKDSCSDLICVQKKRVEVNQLLLGVDNVYQSQTIKDKIIQVNLKNFGYKNPMQNPDVKIKRGFKSKIKHKTRNKIKLPQIEITNFNYEEIQINIQNWLNSFGFNFQKNDFLYDSSKNLGIEYCGLLEHNEFFKNHKYHYNKYKSCLDQNIQLLTIFSDEWLKRERQCKGHIKSILGINTHKLFARKCEIKEVEANEARNFFQEYHIQGKNNLGIIFYGLYFDKELVGAMSLGRHNRQFNNLVLDRLCFKDGYQIIGGASRLFSKCIEWAKKNNYKEILSFSDNRWSIGKVYEALNFKLDKELSPDYSYVNIKRPNERISKQSQKKGLNCPEEMTEHQWALERGLARIWDCGKKRWVFTLL